MRVSDGQMASIRWGEVSKTASDFGEKLERLSSGGMPPGGEVYAPPQNFADGELDPHDAGFARSKGLRKTRRCLKNCIEFRMKT